jgi:ABC-type nickel/cobalt efflux system permease component RcnA
VTARLLTRAGVLGFLAAVAVLAAPPAPAAAHPLGNFSVNQYTGLTLSPASVTVLAAVNTAEIPTRQDRSLVDSDRDGTVTAGERAGYAGRTCPAVAGGLSVQIGGHRLTWTVTPLGYEYQPGAGGLPTARLSCRLAAPADLSTPSTVTVANRYLADRVGWHEMTAVGDRLVLDSPLPERSRSDELRAYPPVPDPASVLDVWTATVRTAPGTSTPGATAAASPAARAGPLATATGWAERGFQRLAGGRLTPWTAVLCVLVAVLLGAGHAALPGHGKTVLAAYLAGRDGRPRDAVFVGATVTATHTAGVLVVGLLLTTTTALAGDRLQGYLGVASGVLIALVGIGMLAGVLRGRPASSPDLEHHEHHHPHPPVRARGRLGLAGLGVAGGLVPSPSALVVLLAAVGLGRPVFGVLLVLTYGLGMAGTLTAAGLLLLAVRHRVTRLRRLAPLAAPVTAALVLVVGVVLATRAALALA